MRTIITKRRVTNSCTAVAALAMVGLLAACGGNDAAQSHTAGLGGVPPKESLEVLSDADQERVREVISPWVRGMVNEHQTAAVPSFTYGPFERMMIGFVPEGFDVRDSCQQALDFLAALDGPPGTVPVQVIEYREDGSGAYDVLAAGVPGGQCELATS